MLFQARRLKRPPAKMRYRPRPPLSRQSPRRRYFQRRLALHRRALSRLPLRNNRNNSDPAMRSRFPTPPRRPAARRRQRAETAYRKARPHTYRPPLPELRRCRLPRIQLLPGRAAPQYRTRQARQAPAPFQRYRTRCPETGTPYPAGRPVRRCRIQRARAAE